MSAIIQPAAGLRGRVAALATRDVSVTLVDARLDGRGIVDVGRRAASVLSACGVGEGDVVLTVCDNGVAQLATWLGCIELGAVFAPLSTLLVGAPLAAVARHSGARVMVCQARYREQLCAVRASMPALSTVVWAGDGGADGFEERLSAVDPDAHPVAGDDVTAPARLMYTSGTTGEPKGVLWSRNAEALHAIAYGDELVRVDAGENVYCCLPMSHATCQGTTLGTLFAGGHVTVDERFNAFGFWDRVRDVNAVFFPYVGTLLATLDRRPRRADDAAVPVRRVMGSAAPADRWRAIEERFALAIEDVWGQTETASCWTRPHRRPATPGTVGSPVERFDARILADGRDVAPGEPGELVVRPRAPHVMFEGYLGVAESPYDADGWYRTGDLVHASSDGDLVFGGRLRDAIRRHGEMLSPSQVEEVASLCPDVGAVAAVAVPNPDGIEDEIMLCVTGTVDVAELDRFCAEHLPRALRPRYYRRCEELPMTPTTKVRRHLLRTLGVDGAWDRRTAPAAS